MRIAILGWGSLLWDLQARFKAFEDQHEKWQFDGPTLRLEFSRISQSRSSALTLVIDPKNGDACTVAYAFSKRKKFDEAVNDLQIREGMPNRDAIGFVRGAQERGHDSKSLAIIRAWAKPREVDVIWTDLKSNFASFSIPNARSHIQGLSADGKMKAAEYVRCAPTFIDTPLRRAVKSLPGFA